MKNVEEDRCILNKEDLAYHAWKVLWDITRNYTERMCFGEPWYTPKEKLKLTEEEYESFFQLVNISCKKDFDFKKLTQNCKLNNNNSFQELLKLINRKENHANNNKIS